MKLAIRPVPLRLILGYHSVSMSQPWVTTNTRTTPAHLVDHIKRLQRIAPIVPLQQLLDDELQPGVALTFDDGYSDNAKMGAEVLRSFGNDLSATFFISSRFVEEGIAYYWDSIDFLAATSSHAPPTQWVIRLLHELDGGTRWDVVRRLSTKARERGMREDIGPMNMREVEGLSAEGQFTIANHGATHFSLGRLQEAEVQRDLRECDQFLAQLDSAHRSQLAFPFGTREDVRSQRSIGSLLPGILSTFSTRPESLGPRTRSPLPRLLLSNETGDELEFRVRQAISRRRRKHLHSSGALGVSTWRKVSPVVGAKASARSELARQWLGKVLE